MPHPDMSICYSGHHPTRIRRGNGSTCGRAHPQLLPQRPAAATKSLIAHLDRPKIDISWSPAKCAGFCTRWGRFQNGISIPAAQAPAQLLQCLDEDKLFSTASRALGARINMLGVDELLLSAQAEASCRHPGGHRDARIGSPIHQANSGREVPAIHRPRARPSDQFPVRAALPARRD